MKEKFLKIAVTMGITLISMLPLSAVVNAESVYKGKVGNNDVWHVTGDYHIHHELEWIRFENRTVNGGLMFAKLQIYQAAAANKLGKGYLKVIKHPDGRWTYEAVTWI